MGEGESINGLLHRALWETGGESIEGGFVDRYESYSDQAIDALLESEFGTKMTDQVKSALANPKLDLKKANRFVYRIGREHPEFPLPLRDSDNPQLRAIYYMAAGQLPGAVDWEVGLRDPVDRVRAAALTSMCGRVPAVAGSDTAALRALTDPSPLVRSTAAARISFFGKPSGAEALARTIERDIEPSVAESALLNVAETVDRAGITLDTQRVEAGLGRRLKRLLIQALEHGSTEIREKSARALHRLREPQVARAVLTRLEKEEDHAVRGTLLLYPGFATLADEAFPVLARLATEGDDLARVRASFLLGSFGSRAIEPLRKALEVPQSRRAAAMSLGNVGDLGCLPELVKALWDANDVWLERDLESAVTSVAINAAHGELEENPEPASILQPIIDAESPRSLQNYPGGAIREEFNALPVFGSQLETWSIRADGVVLSIDHESVRMESEVIEDPLKIFAVYLRAAIQHPEIEKLLPKPPKSARLCRYCLGTGMNGKDGCSRCERFGWVHKDY